jgi:hypothetical protein
MPTTKKHASSAARQAAYRERCKAQGKPPTAAPATGSVYRRWEAMRKQALSLLEQVVCEMETYHTQRSEPWQDSPRGEASAEMLDSLADAAEVLKDIPSNFPDA